MASNDRLADARRFAAEPTRPLPVVIGQERLSDFCRRWKIQKLELFGSVLKYFACLSSLRTSAFHRWRPGSG